MVSKIKVLHVFSIMDRGGAETMIMDLYRKIDREKIEFEFVVHSQKKGSYDDEIKDLGGKIHYVPKYNGLNHFAYKESWKEILSTNNFNIIHGHVRSTASIYLKLASKFNIITIAHSHSNSNGNSFSSVVKNIYQLPIRKIADYCLAASLDAAKWLFGNESINKKNFLFLKNAIDVPKYVYNESIRKKYRIEMSIEKKFVIGHIGSFRKSKNQIFVLEIFKCINNIYGNSVLILVGDGPERSNIEKKISELNLVKDVLLLGVRADIPEILQAMDVFVFPSEFEGLGIVTIEAQASGLHTIVSEGIPKEAYVTELIESESLKESAIVWAEKILKYNNGYKRRDTSNRITENRYNVNESVKILEEFYKDINRVHNKGTL